MKGAHRTGDGRACGIVAAGSFGARRAVERSRRSGHESRVHARAARRSTRPAAALSTTAMSELEDVQPHAAVRDILPGYLVTVTTQWFGSQALELTSKTPGQGRQRAA